MNSLPGCLLTQTDSSKNIESMIEAIESLEQQDKDLSGARDKGEREQRLNLEN
jgi:hypothetical protein